MAKSMESIKKQSKRRLVTLSFVIIWLILLTTLVICIVYTNRNNMINATLAFMESARIVA